MKEFDQIHLVVLLLAGGVPGQPLLVELDHGLGAFDVSLHSGNKVGLVTALPLDQEHKLARGVSCADNPFWIEASVEPPGALAVLPLGLGLPASARLPLLRLRLGLAASSLEGLDKLFAVQVIRWFPGVIFISEPSPLQQIFDLSVLSNLLSKTFSTENSSASAASIASDMFTILL